MGERPISNNMRQPQLSSAGRRYDAYQRASVIGAIFLVGGVILATSGLAVLGIGLSAEEELKALLGVYGPSATSDALIGAGAIMCSIGLALLVPSMIWANKKGAEAGNRQTEDLKGYWGRLLLLLLSAAVMSVLVRIARDDIGAPHIAELGLAGAAGLQAAFIGVIVGAYKGVGMLMSYKKHHDVEDNKTGLVIAKFCISWGMTTALCTAASMATPFLEPLMASAAVGIVDGAIVLAILTIEYGINDGIERGFASYRV